MPKNAEQLANPKFVQACKLAGIRPSKRQASKYNNRRGVAYYATHPGSAPKPTPLGSR